MAEMQGIQNVNISDVGPSLGLSNSDSLSIKADNQIKMKVAEEDSSEEERVAVDLSSMISTKSLDTNSLPELTKSETNKNFVTKAELMEARNKVQATESASSSVSTADTPSPKVAVN